jgi:RNA polymerase sigma-70 factor (ECF subfamily)
MYVTVQQYRGLERKPDFAGRAVNLLMTSTSGPDIAGSTSFSALIVQVGRDRDRDAFAKLFRHFAPRVKSYLIRLGAGGELAEELAQETLLTVWRRAEVYDPARAAASTWIFTIARNLRIDRARRDNRPPPAEDPTDVSPPPPAPDAVLSGLQDEARVARALKTLSQDQAQVIDLAFFGGKAHSEIALALGLPLGTVKSRLRLAMARLRTALDEPS